MKDNKKAFLDVISVSEGTFGKGDNGYNVLVGGKLFKSYMDHPRVLVRLNARLSSTAAGRYQLLSRYYDAYRQLLDLTNFSPVSQDRIALQQIKERGALEMVEQGHFDQAIDRCKNIWASFPGAGYGQKEHDLEYLRTEFVKYGGSLA